VVDYVRRVLAGQYHAALCMLNQCVVACPPDAWEQKIANGTFRWVAYHALFFADYYLSREDDFALRDLHARGGDEREPGMQVGLSRSETLDYAATCRRRVDAALAAETRESLEGPSGFSFHPISRGELHVYNVRHVQHHAGQLSAFLRRAGVETGLRWVKTGWRD
jgi:hypothetical protein